MDGGGGREKWVERVKVEEEEGVEATEALTTRWRGLINRRTVFHLWLSEVINLRN